MCDECGNPAEPADDAEEARALARAAGFVRQGHRDLCSECAAHDYPLPVIDSSDAR